MAAKNGLIIDVLAGRSPEGEEPPEADASSDAPPPPPASGGAEGLISDIRSQLDRLEELMADL